MARDRAAIRSRQEVADAIRGFTPIQWKRLTEIAKKYAGPHIEWRDLLQTALCRAVEEDHVGRNCPVDLDVVTFLSGVMRSISSSALESAMRSARDETYVDDDQEHAAGLSNTNLNPEELLVRHEEAMTIYRHIMSLFDDDNVAKEILEGISTGYHGDAAGFLAGLDQKTYDTKRRLIRRRIKKAYPDGWRS